MGGSTGEAWKALYSDSDSSRGPSDREGPASRDPAVRVRSENRPKRGRGVDRTVVATGTEVLRLAPTTKMIPQIEADAAIVTSHAPARGRGRGGGRGRGEQHDEGRGHRQPRSKMSVLQETAADDQGSGAPRRSSVGGALGLLEPDSSESEGGATVPAARREPVTKRRYEQVSIHEDHMPMPSASSSSSAPAAPHREPSAPNVHRAADNVSVFSNEPVRGAPSHSKASPEPLRQPPLPPLSFEGCASRSVDGLLASFAGPDAGLAMRWSEGSLKLADNVELPESVAACLRPYQREGVQWLYRKLFIEGGGALLTDEMGLGKTVQVACCLSGGLYGQPSTTSAAHPPGPALVLCPPSLVQNWARELRRWGPFAVEILVAGGGSNGSRLRSLQRIDAGLADVLVASRGLLNGDEGGAEGLCSRRWGCVVIDEVHQAKNPKGQLHRALVNLRCPRKLGLTGTPLQNSLTDMWALLRIAGVHEGWDLSAFESRFGRPIARGQKRKASVKDLAVREDALKEFHELMGRSCLRRTKDDVALMLPGKNDRIVPCPLSNVQRAAYANLLASPDWQLALGKRQLCICGLGKPCLCGVGPIWRYIHQRQAEQKGLEDELAAADDCVCRGRSPPKCMSLSLIVLLQRITNHIELLKPDPQPPKDRAEQAQQELMSELCKIAFSGIEHNLCTQKRVANRMQLGSPDACGKMQMLLPLLRHWRRRGQKVLLFSRSTRLLDILEACLWQQGWSPQVLRLDGGTPPSHRQKLVDEFNTSSTRGIFLISTRAGGVGLNLTSASVVVIFDPDWNPFSDLQAQDRSFRIGQTRVVEVYRLLSAGTIEEQVYVRQVWKQQLATTAIDGTRSARRLDDSTFGLSSLFELHETSLLPSLMAEACTTRAQPQEVAKGGVQVFHDLRGAAPSAVKVSDLWQPESLQMEEGEAEECEHDGGLASDDADLQRRHDATQELELLHGMFDQVNHAKVLRSDTQENLLLSDLPDA